MNCKKCGKTMFFDVEYDDVDFPMLRYYKCSFCGTRAELFKMFGKVINASFVDVNGKYLGGLENGI